MTGGASGLPGCLARFGYLGHKFLAAQRALDQPGREGVGGQILWRPTGNLDFVWNTYTLGRDTLGNNNRSRYHEDDSQEWKYYENPNKFMHRAAFTVTEDALVKLRPVIRSFELTAPPVALNPVIQG